MRSVFDELSSAGRDVVLAAPAGERRRLFLLDLEAVALWRWARRPSDSWRLVCARVVLNEAPPLARKYRVEI